MTAPTLSSGWYNIPIVVSSLARCMPHGNHMHVTITLVTNFHTCIVTIYK